MNPISRSWLAFAAIGAALIHLAVGAAAPFPVSIILVGLGIAELGWGVVSLGRGRIVAREATLALALVPVFAWGVAATLGSGLGVSADSAGLPFYPMAVASLFDITLAAALAVSRRRATRRMPAGTVGAADTVPARPSVEPPAWRFLAALMIGSLLFSGLTTSALAGTEAGKRAVPHGSHSIPTPGSPPSTHSGH